MTDPSLFIRWGDFQVGATGHLAIIALLALVAVAIGIKWRG